MKPQLVNLLVVFCCCVISARTIMAMRVGGISDNEKEPNDEVQQLLASLSSEIKSSALATLLTGADGPSSDDLRETFQTANVTGLGHKTQVVAGINYFVRTKIGEHVFHVRIYKNLQQNATLSKVVGPKKETDPIEYF